jgi:predicted RNA-binding protein Jag
LARGVFGEVGVLTDEDVKRYKALIPNITRDPAVAKVLMEDLIRTLKTRKNITINNLDKAGYDVKNFQTSEPTESETKKQVEQNTDSVRTQMMSVLTQLRKETDPAKKQELEKQYNDLKMSLQSKQ